MREQFFGLAKLFEKVRASPVDLLALETSRAHLTTQSTIDKMNVLENPSSVPASNILIDQDVSYYRKADSSPTKTVNSLLTVQRDQQGKIARLNEDWDHTGCARHHCAHSRIVDDLAHSTSTSEDGFFGQFRSELALNWPVKADDDPRHAQRIQEASYGGCDWKSSPFVMPRPCDDCAAAWTTLA